MNAFTLDEPTRWLDIGHARLPYWKVGVGPDLVFVHGWPLHAGTFAEIVARLKDRFTCHLFDLPGAGRSQWRDMSRITLGGNIESLRAIAGQLELGDYGLIAHDSGGLFARFLAAEDPRCKALVLGNTEIPGHRPWAVQLFSALAGMPGSLTVFRSLLRFKPARRSFLGFGGCFTDKDFIDGPFFDEFVAPMLNSKKALVGTAAMANGMDWSLVDNLAETHARIQAPVSLVWG